MLSKTELKIIKAIKNISQKNESIKELFESIPLNPYKIINALNYSIEEISSEQIKEDGVLEYTEGYISKKNKIIYIIKEKNIDDFKKRTTLFHELTHLILEHKHSFFKNAKKHEEAIKNKDYNVMPEETEANIGQEILCVPYDKLQEFRHIHNLDITDIANKFNVPVSLIEKRIKSIDNNINKNFKISEAKKIIKEYDILNNPSTPEELRDMDF